MSRAASSHLLEARTKAMDQMSSIKVPDQGEFFLCPYCATSLYMAANNVEATPTLESLPRELKLKICREILRSKGSIELSPRTPYVSGFAFGSLGLLRVSKDFSEMALSVMYGENCFYFSSAQWTIVVSCFEDENKHTVSLSPCLDRC